MDNAVAVRALGAGGGPIADTTRLPKATPVGRIPILDEPNVPLGRLFVPIAAADLPDPRLRLLADGAPRPMPGRIGPVVEFDLVRVPRPDPKAGFDVVDVDEVVAVVPFPPSDALIRGILSFSRADSKLSSDVCVDVWRELRRRCGSLTPVEVLALEGADTIEGLVPIKDRFVGLEFASATGFWGKMILVGDTALGAVVDITEVDEAVSIFFGADGPLRNEVIKDCCFGTEELGMRLGISDNLGKVVDGGVDSLFFLVGESRIMLSSSLSAIENVFRCF